MRTERLRQLVDDGRTPLGRRAAWVIQGLILLSLVTFAIDTLPNLPPWLADLLTGIEVFTVLVFTAEYGLRIFAARSKTGFIFSFYGIVDLLAIAPFWLLLAVDLRSLRVLRVLRLLRIFKLLRYNRAIARFRRAYLIAREELLVFLLVTVLLLYLSAVGIYYFERMAQPEHFQSVFHALWWSVATLTTVGYGDVYPITIGGRIFTFFVLMLGLGIVALPAGLVASALAKARAEQDQLDAQAAESPINERTNE